MGPTEDTWLAVERLPERPPPPPGSDLAPWLRAEARPSPTKAPETLVERVVEVTAEQLADLVKAGLVDIEEVAPVQRCPGDPERWAVTLRPAGLPDVTAALERYVAGPWRAWAKQEAPRRREIAIYGELFKAHAQIAAAGGEGGQELVVGLGLARWVRAPYRLNVPLIEQRAEFDLDEANGTLSSSAARRAADGDPSPIPRDGHPRCSEVATGDDCPAGRDRKGPRCSVRAFTAGEEVPMNFVKPVRPTWTPVASCWRRRRPWASDRGAEDQPKPLRDRPYPPSRHHTRRHRAAGGHRGAGRHRTARDSTTVRGRTTRCAAG